MTKEKRQRIALCVISVFLLASLTVMLIYIDKHRAVKEHNVMLQVQNDELTDSYENLNSELDGMAQTLDELCAQLDESDEEIEELSSLIAELESEIVMHENGADEYSRRIEQLEAQLYRIRNKYAELRREKKALDDDKRQLESENSDFSDKIDELMAENSELKRISAELAAEPQLSESAIDTAEVGKTTEAVDDTKNADSELLYILENSTPYRWYSDGYGGYYQAHPRIVAYGYYDIDSGDYVGYRDNEVLYSASLIKAPYIYSVLLEIEDFESKAERDEDGNIIYNDINRKYNLDEIWVFDKYTMTAEGSGEIKDMDNGINMTWLDLFGYALRRSDNIAFSEIQKRFGYASFNSIVAESGISGTSSGFMNLSVSDCVKFMRKIYDFFETDSKYAAYMKECLKNSKHPEIISSEYSEGMVAHKYGWDIDAYHDMAIVFDEHPYIVVIMTDLDSGGDDANEFFHSIINCTKAYHSSFYDNN